MRRTQMQRRCGLVWKHLAQPTETFLGNRSQTSRTTETTVSRFWFEQEESHSYESNALVCACRRAQTYTDPHRETITFLYV